MDASRSLLDFWFGALPASAESLAERFRMWFGGEDDIARASVDASLQERFARLMEQAPAGELDNWASSPRRRLALILLLDQLPRNVHRGTPRAFAQDAKALALAMEGMQLGADAALDVVERLFFYMPLQHAESVEVQGESVAAFRRLVAECPAPLRAQFEDALRYAELHRDIVERFGRFPHRNRIVGRASTPAERDWLARDGARFGQ